MGCIKKDCGSYPINLDCVNCGLKYHNYHPARTDNTELLTKEEIDQIMVDSVACGELVMKDDKKWSEYLMYPVIQLAIHANDYRPTEDDFEPLMHRKYSGNGW